jgi:hypothetical protein
MCVVSLAMSRCLSLLLLFLWISPAAAVDMHPNNATAFFLSSGIIKNFSSRIYSASELANSFDPELSSRQLTEDVQYLGNVSNFAGLAGSVASTNGVGTNSRFNNPHAISIAPDGIYALVVDRLNQIIRKIIISTAAVSTFAGVAGEVGNTNAIGTNSKF